MTPIKNWVLFFLFTISSILQPCPAPALITVPASDFTKSLKAFSDGTQALSDLLGIPKIDTSPPEVQEALPGNYGIRNVALANQVTQIKQVIADQQRLKQQYGQSLYGGPKPYTQNDATLLPNGTPALNAALTQSIASQQIRAKNSAEVRDLDKPILDLVTPAPEEASNLRANQIAPWEHQNAAIGGLPTPQVTNPLAYGYWLGTPAPGEIIPPHGITQAPIYYSPIAQPVVGNSVGLPFSQQPRGNFAPQYPHIPQPVNQQIYRPPQNNFPGQPSQFSAQLQPQGQIPNNQGFAGSQNSGLGFGLNDSPPPGSFHGRYDPQQQSPSIVQSGAPNFQGFQVGDSNGNNFGATITRPPTTTLPPTTTSQPTTPAPFIPEPKPKDTLVLERDDVIELAKILNKLTPEELGTEEGTEILQLVQLADKATQLEEDKEQANYVNDRLDGYDWASDTVGPVEDDNLGIDTLNDEPDSSLVSAAAQPPIAASELHQNINALPETVAVVATTPSPVANFTKEEIAQQLKDQLFRASKEFERVTLPLRKATQQDLVGLAQATGIPFTQWQSMQTIANGLKLDEQSIGALLTPPSTKDLETAGKALEGVTRPPSILDAVAESPVINNFASALSRFGVDEASVKRYGSLGLLSLLSLSQQAQQQQAKLLVQKQKEKFVQDLLQSLPETHQHAVRLVVQKHLKGDPNAVAELKQVILHGLQEKRSTKGQGVPSNLGITQAPIIAPQPFAPLPQTYSSVQPSRPAPVLNDDNPNEHNLVSLPQTHIRRSGPPRAVPLPLTYNPEGSSEWKDASSVKISNVSRGIQVDQGRKFVDIQRTGPDSSRFKYLSSKPRQPKKYLPVDQNETGNYATRREELAAKRRNSNYST